MRRIVWSEPALNDLKIIRFYIGQFNPAAAQRMALRILDTVERLAEHAERGRPIGKGQRELAIVWPYLIRYRIAGNTVFVLRIRHGARRPI